MTNPERWRQVRDFFEGVLAESPANPDAWLRERGADSDVCREVVSLLDHHTRAGSFLVDSIVERAPSLLEDDEPTLEAGATVGHYRIDRELGRGAMGRVYRATDTRLGRAVALKALAPHLISDASHRERLRREARAAAALTHSGICTVYALEEIDGHIFIASELVDGHTLRDEIGRGVPSADTVVTAACELADALGSAHARGVVHRDVKPENIMRSSDGRLKILDFGLARLERHSDNQVVAATAVGALVGTPAYMSPEQLNGQPADARSDVFSLGIVLYEYACGSHPFAAATPLAVAARVLESEPAPIASRCPLLAAPVAKAIDQCLRKLPDERFESATALLAALRAVGRPATVTSGFVTMWRVHQLATMLLYVALATVAWWIKEFFKPSAMLLGVFVAIGVLGATAGVMRGHLLFTARLNAPYLAPERRRLRPALVGLDLLMAGGCALAGLRLAAAKPIDGVLIVGLAVGLALATVLMEPATTRAAFSDF